MKIQEHIEKIEAGGSLGRVDAEAVMLELLAGGVAEDDTVRLLAALRAKGETVEGVWWDSRRRCGGVRAKTRAWRNWMAGGW